MSLRSVRCYINVLLYKFTKDRFDLYVRLIVKRVKKESLDSFEVLELPGHQG
jgi:hypothetical protein